MKILLFGRIVQPEHRNLLPELVDWLQKHNATALMYGPYKAYLQRVYGLALDLGTFEKNEVPQDADALISLGGDGTMLEAMLVVGSSGIPMLGFNLGRLGFLSPISKEVFKDALTALAQRAYSLEKRSLLMAEVAGKGLGEQAYALNEITVMKKDTASMVEIRCYLNEEFFNTYRADGLIISTPTGSTGYGLSCGGPIVHPACPTITLTPIAPHNLTQRPFVIPDHAIIRLEAYSRNQEFLVSLDSRSYSLKEGTALSIRRAPFGVQFIQLPSVHYLDTLRNKLLWGKDARN